MPCSLPPVPLVRALSVHADYACARSGACCRAGWTIPLERQAHAALAERLASGRLARPAGANTAFVAYDADDQARLAFAHDDTGACVFLARDGSSRCAIHRDAGEALLPVTCRQFPRVAVLGDDWADVTLSHFCPTAARRLVFDARPLTIVSDPACCRGRVLEGLDTRGHLPPLLRPDALHSAGSWRTFEAAAVAVLDEDAPVGRRLARLDAWARRIDTWTPRNGPLELFVEHTVASSEEDDARRDGRAATGVGGPARRTDALDGWRRVWQAVPPARAAMPDVEHLGTSHVVSASLALKPFDAIVGRYLATKVFASWVPWMATRTSTLARFTRCAHHVVVVEAARHGGSIDRDALVEIIRQADRLLVHLAEAPGLVRILEGAPPHAPPTHL